MKHERPTDEIVKKIYKNARWFTLLALLGCSLVYGVIAHFSESATVTQARFNSLFQSVLIAAWVLFMFPYISVTLKSILYGIEVNAQMADVISSVSKSDISEKIDVEMKRVRESMDVWKRVGERVEAELPGILKKVDEGFKELSEASKKLSQAVEKSDSLAQDARPVIESLKRIEATLEAEIGNGLIEDLRSAALSIRSMGGIPSKNADKKPASYGQEDLDYAVDSIRKSRSTGRA